MFKNITDPYTKKKYSTSSPEGKHILNQYINNYNSKGPFEMCPPKESSVELIRDMPLYDNLDPIVLFPPNIFCMLSVSTFLNGDAPVSLKFQPELHLPMN